MVFQKALLESLKAHSPLIAVETASESFSYEYVLKGSNAITRFLLAKNVPSETRVGLEITDNLKLIISMIGVMNARCVVVPIDPGLPRQRRASMIEDLGLTTLITSRDVTSDQDVERESVRSRHVYEDIIDEALDGLASDPDYPEFKEDDSLYVYFTSGTTGKPKGIIGRNCSLTHFIKWEIAEFSITPGTRFSQFISPYFDAFLRDIFTPLISGGTICLVPTSDELDTPDKLTSWITSKRINFIHCVPSFFDIINHSGLTDEMLDDLNYVLLSGERIVPLSLKKWFDIFGTRIQLVNLYGATETTMIRTFYRIRTDDVHKSKIPIGEPIPDTVLLVANSDLTESRPFFPGDLYILSRYLTKGYLNRPELNKERFLEIKRGDNKPIPAFKTGDKARRLGNNEVELLGREDRQVKLRGIRIELDEVEYALQQFPLIAKAVVLLDDGSKTRKGSQNDLSGNRDRLVAFVILVDPEVKEKDAVELMEGHVKKLLPGYMVPSRFVVVAKFPLLSSGKIDLFQLLDGLEQKEVEGPANQLEMKLCDIWKGLLKIDSISTNDSFYEIGGNSLTILRLVGQIYKEFKVRVPLSAILENSTIKKQALLIDGLKKDVILEISRTADESVYPLSRAQERIYYLNKLDPGSIAYNTPLAWQLKNGRDVGGIKRSLNQLVRRHECLRTRFTFDNGELFQIVDDAVIVPFEEVDIAETDLAATFKKFIQPFQLNKGPLFRFFVIHVAGKKTLLLIDIHHIICDGISQINLLKDLHSLLAGKILDPLSVHYRDYVAWEKNFEKSNQYILEREFWLRSFEGGKIPELKLPVSQRLDKGAGDGGGNHYFEIALEEAGGMTGFLKENNVTSFSFLFASFYVYLFQLTGANDIVVGTNSSGRLQDELSQAVGMFTRTLPIRCPIEPDQPFPVFVKNVHQYLIDAINYQSYDLSAIVEELNKKRKSPIENLFSVMFVFQNFSSDLGDFVDDDFTYFLEKNGSAKFPITLFAYEGTRSFKFRLEYLLDHFTMDDAEIIAGQFQLLLKMIFKNPHLSVGEYIEHREDPHEKIQAKVDFNF
ncbi:MAG: amino acid adenylation domain-containing protein [Chryseotalea sp. WA131a]|nr:MAG: amino acid adenylation domain-containing protein [Chryseotalea sp. WA131a]